MNDKRVLMAAIISSVFMILYSQAVLKSQRVIQYQSEQTKRPTAANIVTSIKSIETSSISDDGTRALPEEEKTLLRSKELEIEVGQRSAAVRLVRLPKFTDKHKVRSLEIGGTAPIVYPRFMGGKSEWKIVDEATSHIEFESNGPQECRWRLSYILDQEHPILAIHATKTQGKSQNCENDLNLVYSWKRSDALGGRNNPLEVVYNANSKHHRQLAPIRAAKDVPRGTTSISLAERYFCLIVKPTAGINDFKVLSAGPDAISMEEAVRLNLSEPARTVANDVYIGPRDYFYRRAAGFDEAFKIGFLGQIGLILLIALSWIAKVTGNYGIAIILLSALITCLLAPFTLLSFRSMKKMQELKPKMDKIMAQHKNDPKKANQEVMALYKDHKVSPLSGCLPMFIQLPIFMALFQAISHFIELRGKSFLWVEDLSLPDHAAHLPFSLPILGNELNVLPIAMALVMFLQTKLSQQRMGADQSNPTTQMMSGPIMPVMFGLMFYQFPAGLVLYWITNSIISLAWYRFAQ